MKQQFDSFVKILKKEKTRLETLQIQLQKQIKICQ